MKKRSILIIAAIALAVFAVADAVLVILLLMPPSAPSSAQATPAATAAPVTEPPSAAPTSAATQLPTAPTVASTEAPSTAPPATAAPTEATDAAPSVPDELTELLARDGKTAEALRQSGCEQLITVDASGSSAQIDFYTLGGSRWTKDDNLSCVGYVGANGITEDMHEGGYATPKGLYPIGDAFYINDKPATGLGTFAVTEDTYWVDDPNSKYYNKRVEGTADMDWSSAEHMIDYTTAYEYGCVIDYNPDAVYNAGSAIFFHVSYSSTAGCVGTDRDMVLRYLAQLQASKNPYILIV